MTSSMWSALEQAQASGLSTSGLVGDPMWLNNLSSALNVGDAEFWEETISPASIRQSLSSVDPSNPIHTPTLLRGMKWLLANISKGRDVSDFYSIVVKLVQAHSLQVRKMVYLYLVQYADYSPTTRELSLLSINSFQRGLGDAEQWIRGLALRVLTSIRLPDILQIQILAAQKSFLDSSPYVRKCACTALTKLYQARKVSKGQQEMITELLIDLLEKEEATMVLTSALIAVNELLLDLSCLHKSFRKICHLLTDMDEWGQIIVIDLLARYCRIYFAKPPEGMAEKIDREKRLIDRESSTMVGVPTNHIGIGEDISRPQLTTTSSDSGLPPKQSVAVKLAKRRVVKKGFYSDEEDSSTEEEIFETSLGQVVPSISQALREQTVASAIPASNVPLAFSELENLAPDHRLLLTSAMPLLKSRNAGVVLAVCALAYYCGVASVPTRVAIGKALVRISRDKREIQYVVLTSIRSLAAECPSAFTPYLSDFFITAMDPEFTKLIKLEILTLLALEPAAIEKVLTELGTYARSSSSDQSPFAIASIRSVGRVAETARRVHDRYGIKNQKQERERRHANTIALNCLFGLVTLSNCTLDKPAIVGECLIVSQRIIRMLNSDEIPVEDPNQVVSRALKRILLLTFGSLSSLVTMSQPQGSEDTSVEEPSKLDLLTPKNLPSSALASSLWIMGEFLSLPTFSPSSTIILGGDERVASIRTELARLVARAFPDLPTEAREQGIHLATKFLLSMTGNGNEAAICEHILAMGRLDTNTDIRDRARFESGLIHMSLGLKHDLDALEAMPPALEQKLNHDQAKKIMLQRKVASCSLEYGPSGIDVSPEVFRFGTLSSLVGHKARSTYVPLPPWSKEDSLSSIRDPPKREIDATMSPKHGLNKGGSFYGSQSSSSDDSGDSSSSSSESTSESDASGSAGDESSSSDSDSTSSGSKRKKSVNFLPSSSNVDFPVAVGQNSKTLKKASISQYSTDDDDVDASSNSSSGASSSSSVSCLSNKRTDANWIALGGITVVAESSVTASQPPQAFASASTKESISENINEDLKGLVLAPVGVSRAMDDVASIHTAYDSSAWTQLVRPDLASGLSVKTRYLRGDTRLKVGKDLGLLAEDYKPNVICLQIEFENQKKDGISTFRRLKIQQRSSMISSGSIGPLKVVTPPEIPQLTRGQTVRVNMGIEFAGISDRDGALVTKLEVHFGTGSVPVEIKPNLSDLLQPPLSRINCSVEAFDTSVSRLHGFQRIESRYDMGSDVSREEIADKLSDRVMRYLALVPVLYEAQTKTGRNKSFKLRFVGSLPSAGDAVYVLLTSERAVIVCCEHPLAVNSIMNQVKRALNNI